MIQLAEAGFESATAILRKREEAAAPAPTADATLAALRSSASIHGLAKALPEGTVRTNGPGWEQVTVPPTPKTERAEQVSWRPGPWNRRSPHRAPTEPYPARTSPNQPPPAPTEPHFLCD